MIGVKGIATKPITDATATEDCVKSGKIFYNNTGRCIGTYDADNDIDNSLTCTIRVTSNMVSSGSSSVRIGTGPYCAFVYPDIDTGRLIQLRPTPSGISISCAEIEIPELQRITGFLHNGKLFKLTQFEPMQMAVSGTYNSANSLSSSKDILFEFRSSKLSSNNNMIRVQVPGTYTFYYLPKEV